MKNNELNEIHSEIVQWLKEVKFRKKLLGGVDEDDVLKKFDELNRLYEKALLCERERYNILLRQTGGVGKDAE